MPCTHGGDMIGTLFQAFAALLLSVQTPPEAKAADPSLEWVILRYGDWIVQITPEASEAGTVNQAGHGFGFVCSLYCIHYIDLHEPCTDGQIYPATATIGNQTFQLELTCRVVDDLHVFVVGIDPEYLKALRDAERITLHVTSLSGRSTNAEFSLRGCSQAATAAAETTLSAGEPPDSP